METPTTTKAERIARVMPHFPDLNYENVEVNREGLAHEVLIVERKRVFRFPLNDWAQRSLVHELRVLDLLRPIFPAPLPSYDFAAADVASYPYIAGRPFTRDVWLLQKPADQRRLAGEVGKMLQAMHAIRPGDAEADRHNIGPSLTVKTQAEWENRYEETRRILYPGLMSHAREWVDRLFGHLVGRPQFMGYESVLMNGDIGTYHLLFDEDKGEFSGVLDFGTAGWGDPACDVGCLIYQYGESFIRQLAAVYPEVAGMIDRARMWAAALELEWALGGLRGLNDTDLSTRVSDWSWFTVHIGFGAKDMRPIGEKLDD